MIEKGKFLMSDRCDSYTFRFVNDVSTPTIQLLSIGHEFRCSADYHWDNSRRNSCWLLQITLSGMGHFMLGDREYTVDAGKGFLLSLPGQSAYWYDEKDTEPWEFVFIMFEGSGAAAYVDRILSQPNPVLDFSRQPETVQTISRLIGLARSGLVNDPFQAASDTFSLLCRLCSLSSSSEKKVSKLIRQACEKMHSQYSMPITLAEISTQLGVSQSHLSRTFERDMGEHPIAYLTRLRMDDAIRLLTTT